ncbi:MAG: helix-turn-helix transcriptional regulator [Gallionella sp.]
MSAVKTETATLLRLSECHLSTVLQANDFDELRAYIQQLLATLGNCDFMQKMDLRSPNEVSLCHFLGTASEPIMNLFGGEVPSKADPIERHFAKSNLPLAWDIDQLCELNAGHGYLLLQATGIRHGLSMLIRSEQAISRIDFYSNTARNSSSSTAQQADLLLLATYIHNTAERLLRKTQARHTQLLSVREIECLKWSACGKTSREIGELLKITQHTVYFHLKNAAMKLGVFGSRHAVSRAIMLGIIQPG